MIGRTGLRAVALSISRSNAGLPRELPHSRSN